MIETTNVYLGAKFIFFSCGAERGTQNAMALKNTFYGSQNNVFYLLTVILSRDSMLLPFFII